jgi:hypothetical protein
VKTTLFRRPAALLAGLAVLALATSAVQPAGGADSPRPRILRPPTEPYGLTYGEWAAEWWKWAAGIPAAQNPILDQTGEFGHIDQAGPVWFLAGTFGGDAERTVTVPEGKALFFPLLNSLWWAPDDLEFAAFVAEEFFGLDPDDLTDEELIRLVANFQIGTDDDSRFTLTVDGVQFSGLHKYRADSPGFLIEDTDLIDDLGIPIAEDNLAVAAGYWVMLAPLPVGEHRIRFTTHLDHPFFGEFELDVTYDITVVRQ